MKWNFSQTVSTNSFEHLITYVDTWFVKRDMNWKFLQTVFTKSVEHYLNKSLIIFYHVSIFHKICYFWWIIVLSKHICPVTFSNSEPSEQFISFTMVYAFCYEVGVQLSRNHFGFNLCTAENQTNTNKHQTIVTIDNYLFSFSKCKIID